MKNKFNYLQQNKQNDWSQINHQLKTCFHRWQDSEKDFQVIIEPYQEERSPKALRGYWRLIGIVTDWMNDKGNHFVKEEVSDYFKIQAGHKRKIGNEFVPKSIAKNAGCTWLEMKHLLDYILQFGYENNIMGCELTSDEEREFKEYYSIKNN